MGRPHVEAMSPLPDEALVVRAGQCLPGNFANGTGVTQVGGKLQDVSVQSAPGKSLAELTTPDDRIGFIGLLHGQVGVTTVGEVRAAGGDVSASPNRNNPYHATLSDLTPEQASALFQPTKKNPGRVRKGRSR